MFEPLPLTAESEPTERNDSVTDGKGPRWLGDNLPSLPPALAYAQSLPPTVTDKYVLFFGFEGPEPECCLQQWYPSPIVEQARGSDGKTEERKFGTSEEYMMFHKALLMGDEATAGKILASGSPAEAKKLGREVKGFKQEIWDEHCDRVVEEGNYLKFSQNEGMGRVLIGTGERGLVETSPNDRLWGIGFNSEEAVGNESEWGENRLGKALERVRARLRESGRS